MNMIRIFLATSLVAGTLGCGDSSGKQDSNPGTLDGGIHDTKVDTLPHDTTFDTLRPDTTFDTVPPDGGLPPGTWIMSMGGVGNDVGSDIVVDTSGNVYVLGAFYNASYFGSFTLISTGGYDVFLVKFSPTGQVLWAKSIGGPQWDWGNHMTLDKDGNIVVTGHFMEQVILEGNVLSAVGAQDIFVAKYSPAGKLVWVNSAGGAMTETDSDVAVDALGNTYLTGHFKAKASFDLISLTSEGGDDLFVARLSHGGEFDWATQASGAISSASGKSIGVDSSNDIYVTGLFNNNATFESTTITSAGKNDVFVAKYSHVGDFLWATPAGGTDDDEANSLTLDSSNNAYIAGDFRGQAAFGTTSLFSKGAADVFVAKIDPDGKFVWATAGGGLDWDHAADISIDANGYIYLIGSYSTQSTFGPTILSSTGAKDIFIAKLFPSGQFYSASSAGGYTSDSGYGIVSGSTGFAFVTGDYGTQANFGNAKLT
ncbi:MAG: SBBP repeat-containing protein, partial [Pseudomonadota bacterium]